ncbi:hypothetical protein ALP99_102066 [Pseudomonas syringae pv. tomato]|nr:putative glycoside hydrolase [Pseudomonas syringae pv. tomato]RMQ76725.1 hypothetical protein ALP99_102066 [Pseudomonas syringae pv. tomato]RMU93647.1 hypothetical protein ALP19_101933 [Pseudomonas syringae pv. tomato]
MIGRAFFEPQAMRASKIDAYFRPSLAEVSGYMLFRHMFLRASQTQQVVDYLKLRWADV